MNNITRLFVYKQRVYNQPVLGSKNHTHVKKVGHTNFCLAFIGELEKQLFIKKTAEVGKKNVRF